MSVPGTWACADFAAICNKVEKLPALVSLLRCEDRGNDLATASSWTTTVEETET